MAREEREADAGGTGQLRDEGFSSLTQGDDALQRPIIGQRAVRRAKR